MTPIDIVKLLHVLSAFWFVAGVAGRDITFWRAGRSGDVRTVHELLQVSEEFERWGVIRGGIVVLVFGLITTWLGDWPLFGILQGAESNWLLVSFVLYIAFSALIGPLGLVRRRKNRTSAVYHALAEGEITPELTAALRDPVVTVYRVFELLGLAVIIYLMEIKPF
jgi:uncharacterized membrane protein